MRPELCGCMVSPLRSGAQHSCQGAHFAVSAMSKHEKQMLNALIPTLVMRLPALGPRLSLLARDCQVLLP
eukprot:scaffold89129_cov18-Tisochrysis_lutea.AAC.1